MNKPFTPLKVSAPVRRCPLEETRGEELKGRTESRSVYSPSLNDLHLEVWSVLQGGVDSLGLNDFGNPWPAPRGDAVARALSQHDPDLCLAAAKEAREIVISQDRAPNVTSLFEKKLRDLAEVRATVRRELVAAGGEG
jgi:hypothetical protein